MTFEKENFLDKQAVITGATTGIGAGIANYLASLGVRVTVIGFDHGTGYLSSDVSVEIGDVNDSQTVNRLFDRIERLDIVINCAGIIRREAEHQIDVFEQVLAVNLTGTMRVCSAARPLLRESRGAIVNTASMLSYFGGSPAYSASKGGIAQLTKSLALAYADDGVRVNAVAPGWISTPMTQPLRDDAARSKSLLSRTPLGRWGSPDDVSGAVTFLCSPAAAFITGVILPVDGGYLIS